MGGEITGGGADGKIIAAGSAGNLAGPRNEMVTDAVAALAVAALGATWVLSRVALRGSRIHLLATCAIVAGLLGGGTEVTQAPGYATESFWVFVGLVLVAAVSRVGSDAEVDDELADRRADPSVATR